MHGVFLERGSVDAGELQFTALEDSLETWEYHATSQAAQMQERLAGAQVAVVNKLPVNAELLAGCPSLELICVSATGYDNIDLTACAEHGVQACNARGYATASVSQHVFALILSLKTHQPAYQRQVRDGQWSSQPHFALISPTIGELSGKTLGIIGYGGLGSAVADLGRAFGMSIKTLVGSGARRDSDLELPDLLKAADVLSLHCPLTDDTRNLIGAQELKQLGQNAILINTARGGIVNEDDLLEALKRGDIAGAGVDVLTQEPPPPEHPLLVSDQPNLIITPHSAWASVEARQRLLDQIAENILAFRAGDPIRTLTA